MKKYNIEISDESLKPIVSELENKVRAEVSVDIARNYLNDISDDELYDIFYNTISARYFNLRSKNITDMTDHEILTVMLYHILIKYIPD